MIVRNWAVALLAASAMATVAAAPANAVTHKTKHSKHRVVKKAAPDTALRDALAAQQLKIDQLSAQIAALQSAPPPAQVDSPAAQAAIAQAALLKTQVDTLQSALDSTNKKVAANAASFGAAPTLKGSGFSFKPNGEIQFDAGYVSNPNHNLTNVPNSATGRIGFNERSRRLLLGAAGDLPGDFKYAIQFDFAQSAVNYEDIVLSYEPKGKPFTVTVGYFYPYSNLDNLTSNRFVSVVERTALSDAFGETRRLGIGLQYTTGDFRVQGGFFGGNLNNANYDNNDYQATGRVVYAPTAFGGQLHFAANAQYRHFRTSALGFQYRSRPETQITDVRFVDTAGIAAESDAIFGVEALGIFGPLHLQGEAQVLRVKGFRPGTAINNGIDPGQALLGSTLAGNPTLFGGYAEAGYWLTGETRGYKNFKIDRTKIINGFDRGGWGGVQLVGRFEYVNLADNIGGVNSGTQVINGILNGGSQTSYIAALNWWPIDYVRFTGQYMHEEIQGGPRAGVIVPLSTLPIYQRKYGLDAFVIRAQLDF